MSLSSFLYGSQPPAMTDGSGTPGRPHGFAGYLDSFLNPQNTLGQFGRALVEAGGTPIGDAFGIMDQQRHQNSNDALDRQYKMAQIEHLGAGPAPDDLTRHMIAGGIDPNSAEGRQMYANAARHAADPIMTNVTHDQDPTTGAIIDRVVGVPYSQLYGGGGSQAFGIQPPAQPTPGALAPAQAAPAAPAGPVNPLGMLGTILPGARATSGLRTPAEQAALYARGATPTLHGDHVDGNAFDMAPMAGMSPQQAQATMVKGGLPVTGILDESKPGMGTGPHWHVKGNFNGGVGRVGGHQTGGTAPNRDKLIADAQAAIAAGADPAQVAARLRSMGVQ